MRKYRKALFVFVKKLAGTWSRIVAMIMTIKLRIKDFCIGFLNGIMLKERSRKELTKNPMIKPPIRDSSSMG
jgi:hypothetical protein